MSVFIPLPVTKMSSGRESKQATTKFALQMKLLFIFSSGPVYFSV